MKKNNRIVILGGNSFVASNFINLLKKNKKKFLPIFKKKIDLTNTNSIKKLSRVLKKNDSLVFISAIAPVKNFKMLIQNLDMCKNVFEALKKNSYMLLDDYDWNFYKYGENQNLLIGNHITVKSTVNWSPRSSSGSSGSKAAI